MSSVWKALSPWEACPSTRVGKCQSYLGFLLRRITSIKERLWGQGCQDDLWASEQIMKCPHWTRSKAQHSSILPPVVASQMPLGSLRSRVWGVAALPPRSLSEHLAFQSTVPLIMEAPLVYHGLLLIDAVLLPWITFGDHSWLTMFSLNFPRSCSNR